MRIERHQDIIAWQLARELERLVFAFTDNVRVARDADFCRQIQRSSSSSSRNISEGFGRFWPAEFAHKMRIAIGELEETQDHLDKALEMRYVTGTHHLEMYALADRAIGAAVKLAEYLEAAAPDWKEDYLARKRDAYRAKRAKRAVSAPPAAGSKVSSGEPGTPGTNEPRTRTRTRTNEPKP
jgi:four helix bundle protein